MMKKNYLLLAASILLVLPVFGQNVGINEDGSRPNTNAILDLKSRNKGILIPRMDSVARNAIPNTKGLLVYDISTDNFWYNTGEKWECIPNDKDRKKGGEAWLLNGNANTKDGVDFLGTTDEAPLNIRVNNQPSGRIDTASGSTFWGYRAGGVNSGLDNTAIGSRALISNTRGNYNTAIGTEALFSVTTGSALTATGYQALYHSVVPPGAEAGEGFGNTADGYQSLFSSTLGYNNTAVGSQSLYLNVAGGNNTANGYQALYSNTFGGGNCSTGYWCLFSNTTGDGNTASGSRCMFSNTTGQSNTASGGDALASNTSGSENTANGIYALGANTTGNGNTATGRGSLTSNNGTWNTANGYSSLYYNSYGNYNTADGAQSLAFNTTGTENVADGYLSLYTNTSGSQNTAIGSSADVSIGNLTNATAIGSGAIVDASNKVRIGNSAVTVIEGQVPFTTPSDGRYKFNVREDVKGLDFILQLRPVTYQFDVKRFDANLNHGARNDATQVNYAMQTGYDEATRLRRTGFIAQEVEQAANASGYDFSGIIKPKTEQDHYSLSYDAFVVPLVKAVQEQQQIILRQNKKLEEQEMKLTSLEEKLDRMEKLLQHANY
jgi:hypothetical protein